MVAYKAVIRSWKELKPVTQFAWIHPVLQDVLCPNESVQLSSKIRLPPPFSNEASSNVGTIIDFHLDEDREYNCLINLYVYANQLPEARTQEL